MAKKNLKKQSRIKTKKKSWFKIIAPAIFGKKEVGESYLTNAQSGIGRTMTINLKNLSGSMKDQNVQVTLKIDKLAGQILQTKTIGYELVPNYVKRVVRKNTSRIDNVFRFETKDHQKVILKSLIVAMYRNKRSTGVELQAKLQELLNEEVSKATFEEFVNGLVIRKIQSSIKKKLNPIYPVKDFSVRSLKVVSESSDVVVDETAEQPTVEVEEEPNANEEVKQETQEETQASEEETTEEVAKAKEEKEPVEESAEPETEQEAVEEAKEEKPAEEPAAQETSEESKEATQSA